jgi:AcrR family transcriptional regulator
LQNRCTGFFALANYHVNPESIAPNRNRNSNSHSQVFARKGYDGTTTRELAEHAGVAEGTLFRHFANKKAILVEIATQGWIEILTDLLTELSEMGSYQAVAQVMRRRMLHLHKNADLLKVCFTEAQFHPDLREHIQSEVINKMAYGSGRLSSDESKTGSASVFGYVCDRRFQSRHHHGSR